jgi:hypothetical protein
MLAQCPTEDSYLRIGMHPAGRISGGVIRPFFIYDIRTDTGYQIAQLDIDIR